MTVNIDGGNDASSIVGRTTVLSCCKIPTQGVCMFVLWARETINTFWNSEINELF